MIIFQTLVVERHPLCKSTVLLTRGIILCNLSRGIKWRSSLQTLKHWSNLAWQHCWAWPWSSPWLFIRPAQEKKSWIHSPEIFPIFVMTISRELFLSPKFVALTPNAWNWPRLSIPGQGALHGPVWAISRESWELWKLRPFIRRLSIDSYSWVLDDLPPCLLTRLHETCLRSQALW